MKNAKLTLPLARIELELLQAEAEMTSSSDLYLRLTQLGLPSEAAIRLKQLLEFIKPIGDKMISVGKIVMLKLIDFVDRNPNLAAGIAVGAALSMLTASVPLLGPLLAPIALALGISVGAIVGHRMDKSPGEQVEVASSFGAIAQDIIEIARAFFQLLIETLVVVSDEFAR